jgi:chlorobactene glucosyltransferase
MTNGGEWRLLDGTRHVSCRMYRSFREAVGGFSKTLFPVFDYRILPYIFTWLMAGLAFLAPVVALILYWMRISLPSPPVEYAALSMVLAIMTWIIASWRFRFPVYLVLFYPLSLALFIVVAVHSFIKTATGTAVWKNRVLDRVDMRWW